MNRCNCAACHANALYGTIFVCELPYMEPAMFTVIPDDFTGSATEHVVMVEGTDGTENRS